ncbi:hypothetical protein [Photorhabdus australis]|uniref:hypothetical protein n=1 Tax=Photorhabdus australis TaxID=286156 RepID=UPI00055B6B20|nr:hypothetical protein [Photorhabdus australis]
MLDALHTFVLVERIELMCKMGCSEDLNDNDRRTVFYWLGELVEEMKKELGTQVEKPLNSGSHLDLSGTGLQ